MKKMICVSVIVRQTTLTRVIFFKLRERVVKNKDDEKCKEKKHPTD